MLQTLTDDGNMTYACHNGCGVQEAHVSQAERNGKLIAMPPCPSCGAQMFLKADFTEEELRAVNMIHPVTGERTPSLDAAERHMALAKQLEERQCG